MMPLANPVDMQATRTPGGLLAAARPLPEGWTRGIRFASIGCLGPFTVGECPDTPDLKVLQHADGVAEFRPVMLGAAVTCTTLDGTRPAAGWAELTQELTHDHALASELLTGAASARDAATGYTGNPSFADASDLGTAASPVEALACIDQDAAAALSGRQVFLHVSVGDATLVRDALWRDGIRWRTAYGSIVIVSSAYPLGTIHATGDVWAGVGDRETLRSVDREVNDDEARTEQVGLVAFDPCYLTSIGTGATCPEVV